MNPRKRRFLIRLTFAVILLGLALSLVEAVLWIVDPLPMSEFLEYRIDGHTRARPLPSQAVANRAGYKVPINRQGFRGPDHSFDKPKGTLRIEVFGGSAAFDFEASSEEKTWPGALQSKLAKALQMPVEVVNLAVPGYDAFNCKINYLYAGRNYHPDVAILYETWNDMGRYRQLEKEPYICTPSDQNRALWEKIGRLTQIGRHTLPLMRAMRGRRLDDITKVDASQAGDLDRPVSENVIEWDRQNFRDFVNFAQSDAVLPILVSMAFLGSDESLKNEKVRQTVVEGCVQRGFSPEQATHTLVKISGMMRDLAAEKNALFVDGYSAVPHDLNYIRDNVHLFDAGSERLALAIADTILKNPRFLKIVDRVKAEKK